MVFITIICLVLVLTAFVLNAIHEMGVKKDIINLGLKLDRLEVFKQTQLIVSENNCLDVQLMHLQNRAKMLGFCLLCPLYQDKAREDTTEKPQSEQNLDLQS